MVASRKANWALGRQGEEEDLFFTLLYLSNLINTDYITSLKISVSENNNINIHSYPQTSENFSGDSQCQPTYNTSELNNFKPVS